MVWSKKERERERERGRGGKGGRERARDIDTERERERKRERGQERDLIMFGVKLLDLRRCKLRHLLGERKSTSQL